jgi:transposase InsO family protein
VLCSTDENPLKITNIEKYLIIDNLSVEYTIEKLCSVLNISSRSFRKWKSKGKPIANNYNPEIAAVIEGAYNSVDGVFGVFRLKEEIMRLYKLVFNHKMIRRYKDILKLPTIVRIKNKTSITNTKPCNLDYMAKNILKCDFKSEAPYQKLSTDVSHIKCTNGTLYLSVVKDLFNNEIISYSISDRNNTNLVMTTLDNLPIISENCIIHSDQGSLYYSWEYRNRLDEMKVIRSMSERGKCWQNSPVENWFSQIKEECLRRIGLMTKEETKKCIEKYVDWYNNQRIQKGLGYLSPVEFKFNY